MKLYLTKTPSILINSFSGYTWRFATDKKELYLTFDDGPIPEITEFVLDTLQQYNAKATFFCIGENIDKHPDIFKRILNEGHAVGNHTYNHLNGWKTDSFNYIENTQKTEQTLGDFRKLQNQTTEESLQDAKLFRPPYGKIKSRQAKELQKLGYKIIMWDVLSADFDTSVSKEQCLKNVTRNVQGGSIIVFHDSIKAFERLQYALPKVLTYFSEEGFTFKRID